MKPRLWVVSELYYPEQTSTGYFLTRIAEGLAGNFEVRVLCGQPTYSEHGARARRRERHGGVAIHRLRATHFSKDRLALRALNLVTLSISAFFHGLFHFRRGDRVLAVTNPPSMPIAIGLAARLRGCRTILLVHDVYPEVLAAAATLRPDSFAYRALARLFGRTYRSFDRIVVLGRDMREVVARKLGGRDEKLT
ncbi:MAG TPA: glycosyltransferase, partial [Allosphingosinicella sp.]|nr:glycosyltransferase [Allosphingosinicella sp.]